MTTIPRLSRGAHTTRARGLCYAEAVAWVAGEAHSDHPECMSVLLAGFARRLNDTLLPGRADLEPQLRALVPRSVGTAGHPDLDERAALMAGDWIVREYIPVCLWSVGQEDEAERLEAMPEITSWRNLKEYVLFSGLRAQVNAMPAKATATLRPARDALRAAFVAGRGVPCHWLVYSGEIATWIAWSQLPGDAFEHLTRDQEERLLDLFERMHDLWDEVPRPHGGAP